MKRLTNRAAPTLPYVIMGFAAIGVLTLGVGLWASTASLSGALVNTGIIEFDETRHVVQHSQGGVVEDVLVKEGDVVQAGETLILMDTAQHQAELSYLKQTLFELLARQARLRAEFMEQEDIAFSPDVVAQSADDAALYALLEGQRRLFHAARDTMQRQTLLLRQRQQQITVRVRGIDAQITALGTQLTLIQTALNNQQSLLSRGLTQAAAVLQLEREKASLNGRMGELIAAKAQARVQMTEIETDILQRAAQHREKATAMARELEQPIRTFRKDIDRLEAEIERAKVRAPVTGVVFGVQGVTDHAVLQPAAAILTVIPRGRAGVVLTRVSPRDIDLVALGQQVKLRLSALDQRLTPEIFGNVTRISADTITDQRSGAVYFEVEVSLTATELEDLPNGMVLIPGMPVETFIQTGSRTPLAYLIKPMTDYFARAFRES
ncbi:MAG: HlyD family type I secretion periplasmic adaptor subunit [Sulfitobacter sp.]|nr:HlyD family type I secretion periplasmic adaptor subunit [Sulfitobacter sp.]